MVSCRVYKTRLKNSDSKGIFVSIIKGDDPSARKHSSFWILTIKCPGINGATNACYNTLSKEIILHRTWSRNRKYPYSLFLATWWLATLFFKLFNIILLLLYGTSELHKNLALLTLNISSSNYCVHFLVFLNKKRFLKNGWFRDISEEHSSAFSKAILIAGNS